MNIKVFLADDNDGFRQALHSLLDMEYDVTVIGEAANGRDAVQQITQHHPDIAILDIVMPELNGIEATRQIRQRSPTVQVVIVSMHETDQYIQEAFKAGARGYILKESAGSELAVALRTVHAGHLFLSGKQPITGPL